MIDHKIKLDPADQAILAKSFTTNVKRSSDLSGSANKLSSNSESSVSIQIKEKMAAANSSRSIANSASSSSNNLHHPAIRNVDTDDDEPVGEHSIVELSLPHKHQN